MTAQATDLITTRTATPRLAVEKVDVVLGRGWRANHVLFSVDLKIWPNPTLA
jgi:hypothetical protein